MGKLQVKQKLQIIRNLLDGTQSIYELIPPKYFAATREGDTYKVDEQLMDIKQFDEWKHNNVRAIDTLIIITKQFEQFGNAPLEQNVQSDLIIKIERVGPCTR